jgi:hypothetical protein
LIRIVLLIASFCFTSAPTTWKQKRGKLAGLTRVLPPGDPQLGELRRDIRAERLAEHVVEIINQVPPLTAEQRSAICALLRTGCDNEL